MPARSPSKQSAIILAVLRHCMGFCTPLDSRLDTPELRPKPSFIHLCTASLLGTLSIAVPCTITALNTNSRNALLQVATPALDSSFPICHVAGPCFVPARRPFLPIVDAYVSLAPRVPALFCRNMRFMTRSCPLVKHLPQDQYPRWKIPDLCPGVFIRPFPAPSQPPSLPTHPQP